MHEDQLDALVDSATHAVNNLIPDRMLDMLDAEERSSLLIRINDALSPILGGLADRDAEVAASAVISATTIAAFLCELVETHLSKGDDAFLNPEDRPKDIISTVHGTGADISCIGFCEILDEAHLDLTLDDGRMFRIAVTEM